MPVTPCLEPRCPAFAETRGRCASHARERSVEVKDRTPGLAVYRTARWKRTRRAVLRRDHYTCRVCRRWGNQVDHIVPIAQGGGAYDMTNLQTLCASCHSKKTAAETLHRED